jgi:hypothetical protein
MDVFHFMLLSSVCSISENCKQQFMKEDGVTLLMAAMRAHSGYVPMQRECLSLIGTLIRTSSYRGALVNAPGGGVLPLIVSGVKASTDSTVPAKGCALIAALSLEGYSRECVRAGGISAVVAAMKVHADSECVQSLGSSALDRMCRDERLARLKAGCEGGIEALVAALQKHSDNSDVNEFARGALRVLVEDKESNNRRIFDTVKALAQLRREPWPPVLDSF